jgi:hypothetical protein
MRKENKLIFLFFLKLKMKRDTIGNLQEYVKRAALENYEEVTELQKQIKRYEVIIAELDDNRDPEIREIVTKCPICEQYNLLTNVVLCTESEPGYCIRVVACRNTKKCLEKIHSSKCEKCDNHTCDGDGLWKCSTCGANICRICAEYCFDHNNIEAYTVFCQDCKHACTKCGRIFCVEHLNFPSSECCMCYNK